MPSPTAMLIAAGLALFAWGAQGVWHGLKKAGHKVGCVVMHGQAQCRPKPVKTTP